MESVVKKKAFLFFLFVSLIHTAGLYAQPLTSGSVSQWYQQNPLPSSGGSIASVFFVTGTTTGWVVGDQGSILKTTNNGTSWFTQSSGTADSLNAVYFSSVSTGWIATSGGRVLSTTNGGTTWTATILDSTKALYSFSFVSASTGWVVGAAGAIFKTTNGGANWTAQPSGTKNYLYSVNFYNSTTGWAVGFGRIILKTTDGGASWVTQTVGSSNYLYAVCFMSATTGWAIGDQGIIMTTTNGGTAWTGQSSGVSFDLYSIYFVSSTTGWIGGNNGTLLKTTNSGTSWTLSTYTGSYPIRTVFFPSTTSGWVAGSNGTLAKTTDAGTTWINSSSGQIKNLHAVSFTSANNGCAAGEAGRVMRTTDGGANWNVQILDSTKNLNSIFFITPDTGWVTGDGGYIGKTVDSGKTWNPLLSGTVNNLTSGYFISSKKGWIAGNAGTILVTSNGGLTWEAQACSAKYNLTSICFPSANVGFAAGGDNNYMLKTTNGGAYWFPILQYSKAQGLYFSSPMVGYAVGGSYSFSWTTDGGNTWDYRNIGNYSQTFNSVYFVSPSVGWVVGTLGSVYMTSDGGNSWTAQSDYYSGKVVTTNTLSSICAISPVTAWAVGDGGTIVKMTNNPGNWLTLTSPTGNEKWVTGTTQTITWKASGVANIKIEYSTDKGTTWASIAASVSGSLNSYSWKVSGLASASCIIRISDAANSAVVAISAYPFSILPVPQIKVISPVGGENWQVGSQHAIKWSDSTVTTGKLEYSTNNGSSWATIIAATPAATGSYNWIVPNAASTACRVRVSDSANAATYGTSPAAFTITAATQAMITIVGPVNGEIWEAASQKTISWVSANVSNVKIEYTTDAGSTWKLVISSAPAAAGTYAWTVPSEPSTYCIIRISDALNATITSQTAGYFTIFTRTIKLNSPVGGEKWRVGSQQTISMSPGNIDSMQIELSTNNGTTWTKIISNLPGTISSYPWIVPDAASSLCRIRVSNMGNLAVKDSSDSVFTIYKPAVTVISPNGGESWVEGSVHPITWTSSNVTNIKLDFSSDNGVTWSAIVTSVAASTASYSWTLPYKRASNCKVRITDVSNSALWDTSAAVFAITRGITLSKDSIAFGSGYVYNPTKLYLTVNNLGNFTVYPYVTVNNTAFTLEYSGYAINSNGTLTIPITFLPTSAGTQTGLLVLDYSSGYKADTVRLSGNGLAITYPSTISLNKTISFNASAGSNDYRMIGLPGKNSATLDLVISGTRGQDWNAYWDNGGNNDYLVEFTDSSKFAFTPGVGYWILSKNAITISKQVASATIQSNYTYKLPLHSGWNIISDPFEKGVLWSKIVYMSKLDTLSVIYGWNGSWAASTQLLPYTGYYFFNNLGLDTLKIPYDPSGSLSKVNEASPSFYLGTQHVTLSLSGSGKTFSTVTAGFDTGANDELDHMDYLAPGGDFEEAGLRIIRAFRQVSWNQYFVEQRSAVGEGQSFDLKARNVTGKDLNLTAAEIDGLTEDVEVYLFDKRLCRMTDIRSCKQITVSGLHKESDFSLLIGSRAYIKTQEAALLPKSFGLMQNYPNPFNPQTIISYQLPVSGMISLRVYDLLGREIKTLVNEVQDAGIHEVVFNGQGFSSGVYFYKIKAGSFEAVKKLMLLK